MPTWPALLLSPLLALGEQSIVYSLATPTCQTQREEWLHLIPLLFFSVVVLLTAMAFMQVRRLRNEGVASPHLDGDERGLRRYFVARVAVWSGSLSALVIVALWIPQWVLSPCAG